MGSLPHFPPIFPPFLVRNKKKKRPRSLTLQSVTSMALRLHGSVAKIDGHVPEMAIEQFAICMCVHVYISIYIYT